MSDYYQNTIGFDILEEGENQISLTADGKNPLLILEEDKNAVEKPVTSTGLYHLALLLPHRETLGQYLIHLAKNNELDGASDHQYSEALYLYDPENNGIEIYADRPPSKWKEDGKGGYVGGTNQIDSDGLIKEAGNIPWSGLPDDTRMGHMHLQVSDLDKSEEFYVNVLGFDIVAKNDSLLFVSKGGYHHHIGMNTWAGKGIPSPPKNTKGLKHYTIILTKEEWLTAKEKLKSNNIDFNEKEKTIDVSDPSGIGLIITY